jgi:all-trans-nonaprenyl-diphosphate synthase
MQESPYLEVLIEREFSQEGDLEKALDFVYSSQGISRSKELANQYGQSALKHLDCLAPSPSKQVLIELVDYVLSRIY